MSEKHLNKRIEWLCAALSKSKLDNERQQRQLDDRGEQIRRLEAALGDGSERIRKIEAALDDRDDQIRDALDERAPSPPAERRLNAYV